MATVLLATVIAGGFILSPADLTRLNLSALFSLLGVSNIYIWMKYGNYFAADASEAPLVHTWSLVYAATGYGLIIFPLFALNPDTPFPGLIAFIPCLGAALLILAGHSDRSRLLTNRPMVFIGLISYSLYLWHWPLIAYLNYLDVDITLPVGISLMGAAISLSWCSWRYIEVPFRRSGLRLPFSRVVTRRFLAPALGLAVLAGLSVQFQGFRNALCRKLPHLRP